MSRRSGGRKSRIKNRLSPLSGKMKPVLPGESGGMYKPLSDKDIQAIIDNSFKILEQVGFSQASQHCIDVCTERGAVLGNDGRLRIPRDLVEETLKVSNHNVKLYGQDPAYDLFNRRSCGDDPGFSIQGTSPVTSS